MLEVFKMQIKNKESNKIKKYNMYLPIENIYLSESIELAKYIINILSR